MARSVGSREAMLKNKITPAILAALATSLLMYALYSIDFDINYGPGASAILFASFGSSAFILFMTPRSRSARIGAFVKSYVAAAVVGAIGFYFSSLVSPFIVIGAAVFALSLLMYALDSQHPPAIGIAVAFVIYRISSVYGILIVVLGVALLLFLRLVLERFVYALEEDIEKDYANGKRKRR